MAARFAVSGVNASGYVAIYDALNRVSRVRDVTGVGNTRILADIFYDTQSRRTRMVYGNGTASTTAAAGDRRTFRYDVRGSLARLETLTAAAPAATLASARWDFTYNGAGQTTSSLLSLDGGLWWSPPSSRSESYAVNGLNQYDSMTTDGGAAVSMVHDGNGNLVTDWQGRSFSYDAENVLRSVTGVVTYKYHPDGTRRQKSVSGVVSRFWYLGDQEVLETSGTDLITPDIERRYIRLPGSIDEAFLMLDYSSGSVTEHWIHQDRIGSAVMVTDASGAVQDRFTYDPYGNVGASNTGFPFRFTGQKLDPETGLYYYKARYYASEIGRFLQTDPIGYEDQMNLYSYCYNDAVNCTDPDGREGAPFFKLFDFGGEAAAGRIQDAIVAEGMSSTAGPTDVPRTGPTLGEKVVGNMALITVEAQINAAANIAILGATAAEPTPVGEAAVAGAIGSRALVATESLVPAYGGGKQWGY